MNILRLLLVLSLFGFANCSAPEPNKVDTTQTSSEPDECKVPTDESEDGDDATDSETDTEDDGEDDENDTEDDGEDDDGEDDDGEDDEDEGANLFSASLLQDEVTYEKDIKPMVEANCAISGCHVAGAQAPVLETYDDNVAAAADSVAEVAAGRMPVGVAYDDDQKDLWQAWFDGGVEEGEPVDDNDDGDEGEDESDTDDGDDGEEDDGGDSDEEDEADCTVEDTTKTGKATELLNEEAVQACHDKGTLYDRNKKECSNVSTEISYACTREGIEQAFSNAGLDASSILDQSLGKSDSDKGEGFSIDQCGQVNGGLPVVVLVRVQEPPETPGLKVRVLVVD